MRKIGVFICHCGLNIAGTVDVQRVAERCGEIPGVVHCEDYSYMCSDPGQNLIAEAIAEKNLDSIVVAACSPTMHEPTFRAAAEQAGINPYQVQMANIREQCSWVHPDDQEEATRKAEAIVRAAVEKVRRDEPLVPHEIPVTKRAMVVGGGITGMQAALDIADAGHPVVLVEREATIGGRMAQLSETFPTLDCASCILTPKMAEVGRHPLIQLMAYSEVEEVSGSVGNFRVRIRQKPTYVDWDACMGCMECQQQCPSEVPSEFERGVGVKKAIGVDFPQAIPNRPKIDPEHCAHMRGDFCWLCSRSCPVDAIDYDQEATIVEEEVGAIVLATGYDVLPVETLGEYGYGKYPDVIDSMAFERMKSSSGPTGGVIRRPSDGEIPKEVVFIQCAGSRDPDKGQPYCSKICCMYTAKHATLYKHDVPDGQAYIFYTDVRAGGKGYEEFVQRTVEEDDALYLRGRVSRVYPEGDKMLVKGVDTLSDENVEIHADLVVLATAVTPRGDALDVARTFNVGTDEHGFFNEAHPKLRPVETSTPGIYVAGMVRGPRDISDAAAEGSGAASKVAMLLSRDEMQSDPLIADVDEDECSGCLWCVAACPFDAIEEKYITRRVGEREVSRRVVEVNVGVCQGCGACTVACRDGAMNLKGYKDEQILAEVETICLIAGSQQ